MLDKFLNSVPTVVFSAGIFVAIVGAVLVGFRYRRWLTSHRNEVKDSGFGPIEGSLLGLMALLMAFTFGMAEEKFEANREIVVEEANDIGTAILRCDFYPDSLRQLLHADFAAYIQARIDYFQAQSEAAGIDSTLSRTQELSHRIWNRVMAFAHRPEQLQTTLLVIPALNNMIDIVATRESARRSKVPPIIFLILILITIASAFLVGYANKDRSENVVLIGTFSLVTTLAFYLIIELNRPRQGMINIGASEKAIVELTQLLQSAP